MATPNPEKLPRRQRVGPAATTREADAAPSPATADPNPSDAPPPPGELLCTICGLTACWQAPQR